MQHPLRQPFVDTEFLDDPALVVEVAQRMGVGCWQWTPESGFRRDTACIRLLGFGLDQLDDLGWLDRVHPEDASQLREQFDACSRGELPGYQLQYRILHHDGQYRQVCERVQSCQPEQRLVGVVHSLGPSVELMPNLIPVLDPLTGGESRQRFEARLQGLLQAQPVVPFSLVQLELDYLDKVRQLYGKDAVDDLLIQLVRLLRHQAGETAALARGESDNILLLLVGMTEPEVLPLAETLRQKVADANLLPHRPITASLGVVTHQSGEQVDHLLARLAGCLQQAREQHNCVISESGRGAD